MEKKLIIIDLLFSTLFLVICLLLVGAYHYPLISPIYDYKGTLSGAYFDLQGLSLTVGRLDTPCDSLQYEAFQIDGKCYGYFGLTPSFFRIILNGLCLSCMGAWSRIMMVLAALLSYASLVLLARRASADKADGWSKRLWCHGFAWTMSIGSSLLFIISDPYGYHEAIIWACAFTLLGFWAIARYVDGGERWALRLALLANFLAMHSRFTVGIALGGATCLWLLAPFGRLLPRGFSPFSAAAMERSARTGLGACFIIAAMSLTPPTVQYLKFGSFMPSPALQPFYQTFPERLERIKDGMFRTSNFRCASALYFSPSMIEFRSKFPWVMPAYRDYWFAGRPLPAKVAPYCADSNIDALDPVFSIPYGLSAPFALFLAGVVVMAVKRRTIIDWLPLALGGAVACLPLLFLSSITYRYTLDFLPLFVVGGVVGWRAMADLAGWKRGVALGLVTALTLSALAVNFSASLYSGSPQPYMARISAGIERLLVRSPKESTVQ